MSVRLHAALEFAVHVHAGQDRDGLMPPPYVCHPVEVLMNLRYIGGIEDEDLLMTALLHDTVEATSTELVDIEKAFGPRVSGLVQELTRYEPSDEERAGLSKDEIWQLRSNLMLKEIGEMSPDAQQVKLADRLSNVREARRAKSPKKFARYCAQTEQILETIPRKHNLGLWDAIRAELDR